MKKSYKLFAALSLFISVTLTGCYDPVFYEIHKDVAPETATVSGIINSITRYTADGTEFLVLAADGGIRYKLKDNNTHDSWKTYEEIPFSFHSYDYYNSTHNGQQILKVLADTTNLYLVTVSYADESDMGTVVADHIYVWTKKISLEADGETWSTAGEWTCVIDDSEHIYFPFYYYGDYKYSAFAVFQSNSPLKENRCIFIRTGNANASNTSFRDVHYWNLSEGKLTSVDIKPSDSTELNNISSVVVLDGKPVFFNSIASTTNETYKDKATRIYYSDGADLYYSNADGSTTFVQGLNAGNDISAIAVCSDAILIGRANYNATSTTAYGGIVKTSLINGVPASELVKFETNAEFQLSSSYFINNLINATPDKTEQESSLYASISFYGTGSSSNVSYKNIGLWSYYPLRGNWNRE